MVLKTRFEPTAFGKYYSHERANVIYALAGFVFAIPRRRV